MPRVVRVSPTEPVDCSRGSAPHGGVVRVDREAELLEVRRGERGEELVGDFEHRPTLLADEMAVRRGCEVVGRGPSPRWTWVTTPSCSSSSRLR